MEQPLRDYRTTKPANSGIAETLMPLLMSASVTLKSGASKMSCAVTPTVTARAAHTAFSMNFMIVNDEEAMKDKG
jgi:hypothetical protein